MPAFARDQIRHSLQKRIDALTQGYRQNVGIIGALGIGKSFILNQSLTEIYQRSDLICLYIQSEACDFEQLIERWIGSVMTAYIHSEGHQPPRSFDELMSACEQKISKTVHHIHLLKKMLRREKGPELVKELFALSRILAEETSKKVVLMIEEFQELEKLPASDPFVLLGQEIMISKDTMYVVSSSKPERAKEIFREKLSLLFGNFEIIELRPFDFQETADFLSQHFPKTRFSVQQLKFFIELTNGEPLYLDLLCDRLKLYLSSQAENILSDALVFLAFQEELLDHRGRLSLIFEKMLQPVLRNGRDGVPYFKTLLAVAEGNHRINQISAFIGRKALETRKILSKLVHEDMISKRGSLYILEDSLFKFWLVEVFNKKNQLFWPSEKLVEDELYLSLRHRLEKICHEEKKEYVHQIERLLNEFRDDVVEIEGRKCRCPQFSEIIIKEGSGRFDLIIAKANKSRWVFQIADDKVLEEDILNFQDDIKSIRKIFHRTLIPLSGIDQNAKLMAQTAKMHIWSLRDCNSLLELYNLSKILPLREHISEESFIEPPARLHQPVVG